LSAGDIESETFSVQSFHEKKEKVYEEYEEYIRALEIRIENYKKSVNILCEDMNDKSNEKELQEGLSKERSILLKVDNRTTDNQEKPEEFMKEIEWSYNDYKEIEKMIEETKNNIENQAKISESLIKEKNSITNTEISIKRKLDILSTHNEDGESEDHPKKRKIIFPTDPLSKV